MSKNNMGIKCGAGLAVVLLAVLSLFTASRTNGAEIEAAASTNAEFSASAGLAADTKESDSAGAPKATPGTRELARQISKDAEPEYAVSQGQAAATPTSSGSPSASPSTSETEDASWLQGVKSIAHRGYSSKAVENTLSAYELAGQAGFWGCECDVWASSDGRYVISHDNNLKRVFGIDMNITEHTWEEIMGEVNITAGDATPAERPPQLSEYIDVCRQYGMKPVIELKQAFSDAQLSEIHDAAPDAWYISFNLDTVTAMKRIGGDGFGWLVDKPTVDTVRTCEANGVDLSANYVNLTDEVAEECRRLGVGLCVWTCDDYDWLASASGYGIKAVTGNGKLF